jgi:hypothetical protein
MGEGQEQIQATLQEMAPELFEATAGLSGESEQQNEDIHASSEDAPSERFSFGKVVRVTEGSVRLVEYDFSRDANIEIEYFETPTTEYGNVEGLNDLRAGDDVVIDYTELGGQRTIVTLVREETDSSIGSVEPGEVLTVSGADDKNEHCASGKVTPKLSGDTPPLIGRQTGTEPSLPAVPMQFSGLELSSGAHFQQQTATAIPVPSPTGNKNLVDQAIEAATQPIRREMPKVGRNEPCQCGSGKKYKQCCGRNT